MNADDLRRELNLFKHDTFLDILFSADNLWKGYSDESGAKTFIVSAPLARFSICFS